MNTGKKTKIHFCPINGLVENESLQEEQNPKNTLRTRENIHFKLFLRIFLALVILFLLLSYGAFRIASIDFEKERIRFLSNTITNTLNNYNNESISLLSNSEKLAWLNKYSHQSLDVLILNASDVHLQTRRILIFDDDFIAEIKNSNHEEFVEIIKEGRSYIWRRLSIPSSSDDLVFLYEKSSDYSQNYFSSLGVGIVITLIILLSVSIWLTRFLATVFEKLHGQKQKMKYHALHDSLTGLPNRALMGIRLEQAILGAKHDNTCVGLLFIDLNLFKKVNDSLGHQCGDKLLISLSQRLIKELRRSDTAARLGGDEFAIVLKDVGLESSKFVAKKVLSAIEREVEIDSNKVHVSASIGVALFPTHASESQELIQKADAAMYIAKKAGSTIAIYNTELENGVSDKQVELLSDKMG